MNIKYFKNIAIGVGAIGALGVVVSINSVPFILNKFITQSEPYTEAIRLLQNNPTAIQALGEPIEPKFIKVFFRDNYGSDEEKMWIKVPVVGASDKGLLYYDYTTTKSDTDKSEFKLTNVELTVDKKPNMKLILKKTD